MRISYPSGVLTDQQTLQNRGRTYSFYGAGAATAAKSLVWQLLNPANSGIAAMLQLATGVSLTAGRARWSINNVARSFPFAASTYIPLRNGGPGAKCIVYGDTISALGTAIDEVKLGTDPGQLTPIIDYFILDPGTGIEIATVTQNVSFNLAFYWREFPR